MNEEVKVDITVSDCSECPYYYGMMRKGLVYVYGKCEKTGGAGENRNLIRNCPYKEKEQVKGIGDYIETDYCHYWRLNISDYIDDIIREKIDKMFKE